MSDSNFRADLEEDRDNKNDGDRDSDQQPLDLRKDNGEFDDEKKDEESVNTTVTAEDLDVEKKPGEEGLDSTEEDDNDGFRTPTSIEHRIPVPTQCPPAPKKSLKRKFEESSITDILRSATKAIHDHIMGFRKGREDDDALS